ncbi:hypothetical protein PAHAL_8G193400 [Panicum hallii]|jgi:hypothetical protein|uniref:RING-type domain-containing protein n=1 Tax=Panicum hallii TaxID=206008 RepID=A0A2S3IEH6_9POAL|nr:hypothetical protein PAHAL_8G193400 [Panicum hallii]
MQGIKMIPVSAGEPAVVAAAVPAAAGDVLGGGVATDPASSAHEREGESAVLGEQGDDGLTDEDFIDEEEEDDDSTDEEDVDSDSEFEEECQPPDVGRRAAAAPNVVLVAAVGFLGRPTRAASVQNTTGFMHLAAAEAAPGQDGGGGGEILVHYRYTRFSRARSGGDDGVDMHVLGPKLARVRFHLPFHAATADPASSLRLAGAALAPLVYPSRFSAQLRALWSGLVAMAPVRAPPRAVRLVVTADVGILRPADRTPERMRSMRAALECVARERDGARPLPAAELHLPAPLAAEDDARPAQRRRVTGEDCPICCDALERGLAAWPRCSHIFHGRCLEEHLVRGHQECPMCRSEMNVNATQ